MSLKTKSAVLACLVLLVGLAFGSVVFLETTSAQEGGTVTYEYYVVAGHEMEPTLPSPATSSDPRFNFTVEAFKDNTTGLYPLGTVGYNFGNLSHDPGYPFYLKAGYEGMTIYGGAYVRVNITNLSDDYITIADLIAEVTDCTPTKEFYGPPGQYWGNHCMVWIDSLDHSVKDEVNYTTGDVRVQLDSVTEFDWWTKAFGIPYPTGFFTGNVSLVTPDNDGDAAATGHVAPIKLAKDSTFTEYFGIIIFGDVDSGTQIEGTITLTLEYALPGYPVASYTYSPTKPFVNETVTFNASKSSDPEGNITSYVWDFGDNTTGTGMIVNHTYTAAETYTVVLNVTDSEGLWDRETQSINIVASPVASFTFEPSDPTVGKTVTFNASASTPNGGSLDDPDSYVWDFGDNTTGTGMIVNHTYTAAETYTVVLNVTDSEGLWDIQSKNIVVVAAAELPWLWIGVGVVVVVVAAAAVAILLRRRK